MATDVCSDRSLLNMFSSFYEDNRKWFVWIYVLLLSLVCLFSHSHIYVAVNVFLLCDIAVRSLHVFASHCTLFMYFGIRHASLSTISWGQYFSVDLCVADSMWTRGLVVIEGACESGGPGSTPACGTFLCFCHKLNWLANYC